MSLMILPSWSCKLQLSVISTRHLFQSDIFREKKKKKKARASSSQYIKSTNKTAHNFRRSQSHCPRKGVHKLNFGETILKCIKEDLNWQVRSLEKDERIYNIIISNKHKILSSFKMELKIRKRLKSSYEGKNT